MKSARHIVFGSLAAGSVLCLLLFWLPRRPTAGPQGQPLLVYCAAGMQGPVEAVAREYEQRFGVPMQLQFGGSGTLLSNLRVAKRGDLYLAADDSYLDLARSNGLIAEVIPLAQMVPVIAVHQGNPKMITGLDDLTRADVDVALANADAAAVGKITRKLLEQTGRWTSVQPRVKVFKPTVNDLANDVKLGTADAAIVWDSTVAQYPDLQAVRVPEFDQARSQVGITVLTFCKQPAAALRFARYLGARDRGLPVFARAGFQVVRGDLWTERPEVLLYSGGVNRTAIEETLRQFEDREGVAVTRVYNGCGILTAQIHAGQRPDAYFACDVSFMRTVKDHFQQPRDLSDTRMIILTKKGNPRGLSGLAGLAEPGLALGVANEQQSALGSLTARLLRSQDLIDRVMTNVKVQTPTADLLVNQLRAGALDAVVVYAANASQVRDSLEVVELSEPAALAIQPYAVGRNSDHAQVMERLLALLRSAESRQRFEQAGFHWRDELEQP